MVPVFAATVHKRMDLTESMGVPIIGLHNGGDAPIQDGINARSGFGGIFMGNVRASGVVPRSRWS
jgi:propionyl-CoA carboxylase beta chain